MSLDKAIEHGKEYRKEYRKQGYADATCRPHGGCPYCERGRLHKRRLGETRASEQLREFACE